MKRAHLILPLIIAVLGVVLLLYCFADSLKVDREVSRLDRHPGLLRMQHALGAVRDQSIEVGFPRLSAKQTVRRRHRAIPGGVESSSLCPLVDHGKGRPHAATPGTIAAGGCAQKHFLWDMTRFDIPIKSGLRGQRWMIRNSANLQTCRFMVDKNPNSSDAHRPGQCQSKNPTGIKRGSGASVKGFLSRPPGSHVGHFNIVDS